VNFFEVIETVETVARVVRNVRAPCEVPTHGAQLRTEVAHAHNFIRLDQLFRGGDADAPHALQVAHGGLVRAAAAVERALRHPLPAATLLNVNVPDIPLADVQGIEVTRLGKRHKAEGVIRASNPRGQTVYWIGAAGEAQDAGPGTDFHAVAAGRVSITPLQMDLSSYPVMDDLVQWLGI
jgi:hypothetical protein